MSKKIILLFFGVLLLSSLYALHWCHSAENELKRARKEVEELLEAHSSSADELYRLSTMAESDGDSYLRFYLLQAAAERGLAQAQYELGVYYIGERNGRLGVKWLTEAAKQGDAKHQYELGRYYEETAKGSQGERKHEMIGLAAKWYLESAERGNGKVQSLMGKFYSSGTGVERDWKKAEKWYLKAERQGEFVGLHLVRLYDETNRPEQAIRQLHKILAKSSYRAPLYDVFGLGELKKQKRKLEEKRNGMKKGEKAVHAK